MTVVLARLLVPEDFGLMEMALLFAQFAVLLNEIGLGAALVQREQIEERHLTSVFWANVGMGILLSLAMAASAWAVAAFFDEPRLVTTILGLAPIAFLGSFTVVQRALLERAMAFRRLAWIELAAAVVSGAGSIAAALHGWGVQSLVLHLVLFTACTAAGLWLMGDWRPRGRFEGAALRELLGYGANLFGFQAFNYWTRNADYLLIGRFVGPQALGFYGYAYRITTLPLTQVTQVLQRVMFPALASVQGDIARVKAIFLRCNAMIGLLTIPVACGLFVLARPFVLVVLGERWEPVVPLLQILCFVAVKQPLGATTGWIYKSQGRTDLMFRWGVVVSLITIGGFFVGLPWGTLGVATSYAVTRYLVWYHSITIPGRLIGLRFGEFVSNVAGVFGCSVAMAVLVWATGLVLPAEWSIAGRFALQVLVGVAAYAALVHLFDLESWRDARALVAEPWQRRVWAP